MIKNRREQVAQQNTATYNNKDMYILHGSDHTVCAEAGYGSLLTSPSVKILKWKLICTDLAVAWGKSAHATVCRTWHGVARCLPSFPRELVK